MYKSIISIDKIREPKVYVKKMIELTRELSSESGCTGIQLIAKQNDNNLFETIVVIHESDFNCHQKNKNTIFISELDFDLLLKLTNEIYRIIGNKLNDPTLIINNFHGDRILVNLQIMGQWNIVIRNLSKEQLEIIAESLNTIKERLIINKEKVKNKMLIK